MNMDSKDSFVINKILEGNNLPSCKTFVKHRNLKEFKFFLIERMNPNHRVFVYGVLKNNNKKKKTSRYFIKVGELLFILGSLMVNFDVFQRNVDVICLLFSLFFLNCFLFYLFCNINILRGLYDYWYRGIHGRWENHFHVEECSD